MFSVIFVLGLLYHTYTDLKSRFYNKCWGLDLK